MERSPWAFKMYKQKIFQAPPHKQKTTKPTHCGRPIFQAHPLRWVGLFKLNPHSTADPWNAVHGLLRCINRKSSKPRPTNRKQLSPPHIYLPSPPTALGGSFKDIFPPSNCVSCKSICNSQHLNNLNCQNYF